VIFSLKNNFYDYPVASEHRLMFTIFYEPVEDIEKNDDKSTHCKRNRLHKKVQPLQQQKEEMDDETVIGIGIGFPVKNTGKLKPVT
jgi:hypothetical protein